MLRAVPIGLTTPLVVRLSGRIDPRYMLGTGFAATALGNYLQARVTTPTASFWDFLAPLALNGMVRRCCGSRFPSPSSARPRRAKDRRPPRS